MRALRAYWDLKKNKGEKSERTEGDDGRLSKGAIPILQDRRGARASEPKLRGQQGCKLCLTGPDGAIPPLLAWSQGPTQSSRSLLPPACFSIPPDDLTMPPSTARYHRSHGWRGLFSLSQLHTGKLSGIRKRVEEHQEGRGRDQPEQIPSNPARPLKRGTRTASSWIPFRLLPG